ncbi:ATP-grasp domain-containing protein [Novosphingobium kunmingense]|uniref:ATP-grasp domain-containing protein n=1 Tax=Novosphingobium kunmingense TaxID=1211806 RepID=A0A2N0I2I9_9SPHN|nr:ATP-grasp domain-containing protein [Novosphingobium kunmingense]PKB25375.1 ATP-grasp domain-containing protein [Novosphingobium kunmingense]
MANLVIVAHVPTDSVNDGFLPAARRLGLSVTLLTDHADSHERHFARAGLPAYPDQIIACDVFNPIALIEAAEGQKPKAIFSNSDHLQTSTATAAVHFGLPGKDQRVVYRAKNKAAMRVFLAQNGIDMLWHKVVTSETDLATVTEAPFPCVVKPREGVGSQLVRLVHNLDELSQYCRAVWIERPGCILLIEEYISGDLYTLETLGDGRSIRALGGFRVTLSPPPHFVELAAEWGNWLAADQQAAIMNQIAAFGVGFGSCHTEFVLTPNGPRLIEINYRTVGDRREFLLEETLDFSLFETILRLHLGEALPDLESGDRTAAMRYFPTREAGELIKAPDAFHKNDGDVWLNYRPLRRAGDAVTVTNSNKDYLGVLCASAPDTAALTQAMQAASDRLTWDIRA